MWRCDHDCDRRECHHCFTKNELDRLVEGHFKQYYAFENSPRPDTKRKGPDNNHHRDELDSSHLYDADSESDYHHHESEHHHPHIKHHRGGCLPDVLHLFSDSVVDVSSINSFHSKSQGPDTVQSVPGLFSSYQQQYDEPTATDHTLSNHAESEPKSKPKRIETVANNNLHRNDTTAHADAIDYESKCDIT